MKTWSIFVVFLMLAWASTGNAEIRTIELANEVRLSDFRPPQSENGTAAFKTCHDCDLQVINVNAATRYLVDGRAVSLTEFRRRISLVQDRDSEMLVVRHHLANDVVTVISIYL